MLGAALTKLLGALCSDRRGNVGLMFGLLAVPLTVAVGVGVDYGMAASARTKLQSAIDAAVLAGAAASSSQTRTAAIALAQHVFTADTSDLNAGASANFSFDASGNLTGTATYNVTKFFGGLLGGATTPIGASAKASGAGSAVCILLLSPSANQALLVNGGADVNATNCEIDSKSTGSPAAVFSSSETFDFTKICLEGTSILNNGGTHPNLYTGCTTASNPFVGRLPAPPSTSCANSGQTYGNVGTLALSPGVYCGSMQFNFPTTVNFAPGVYVIKGGQWTVAGGTWTGAGVTFYFPDSSSIQFNSGMTMNLTAPTSGTYAGILFYEADGLSASPWVWDANVSETLSGLFYLPSRNITWNSPSAVVSHQLTLVANTAIFNTMNWNLTASTTWPITNGGSGSVALMQ